MRAENHDIKRAWPLLSSLAAFVQAGIRPRTTLAPAIVAVLIVKLIAVTAMSVVRRYEDRTAWRWLPARRRTSHRSKLASEAVAGQRN